jgi:5'-3' exonuclease
MDVHLIDGTYELFRHHFALPSSTVEGREVAATRGVMRTLAGMLADGVTHLAVATDSVIESFRNEMWPGYKSGEGVEAELAQQFALLDAGVAAMGIAIWGMTDLEADDALATGAARAAADPLVTRVIICTPDKDLAQCVVGTRVVQLDRRSGAIRDEDGVREKFGVSPASIPDYLALVGDAADGFPGLPGWGATSSAAVLARWGHLEAIPADPAAWDVRVRGAAKLSAALEEGRERALLFRTLATLRTDAPVLASGVDQLRWTSPAPELAAVCRMVGAPEMERRLDEMRV